MIAGAGRARATCSQGGPLPLAGRGRGDVLRAPVRFAARARARPAHGAASRRAPGPTTWSTSPRPRGCAGDCAPPASTHLHAHFGTNAAEVAMLARVLGGPPYSFTVHGPEEFDAPESLHLRDKIETRRVRRRDQLLRPQPALSLDRRRPVAEGARRALRRRRGIPSAPASATVAAARLVCVGRLCEQKGQLLLLEAVRIVLDRGRAFELVLAGDGEMRAGDRGQIERARPARARPHHRLDRQRAGARRNPRGACAGAAELRRGTAGRDHGGDGAAAAGAEHLRRRHPRAGAPGRRWLARAAGDVEALADAIEACLETPRRSWRAWATTRTSASWRAIRSPSRRRKLAELFRERAMRAAAIPR